MKYKFKFPVDLVSNYFQGVLRCIKSPIKKWSFLWLPKDQVLYESNLYQIMQWVLKDLLQNNLLRLNPFTDFE